MKFNVYKCVKGLLKEGYTLIQVMDMYYLWIRDCENKTYEELKERAPYLSKEWFDGEEDE